MIRKTLKLVALWGILTVVFLTFSVPAYASEGEEYVTISVKATDENGEKLMYALDTDTPEAFTSSNEFYVPAGTSHTIYVKDVAGNISSEEYTAPASETSTYTQQTEDTNKSTRDVNIDVVLDPPEYEYAGDTPIEPAEAGAGTVYSQTKASASDPDAEKVFYTVTTDEGEVFYLVIDQGQSSNNVYLLDQVKLSDLNALAVNDAGSGDTEKSNSLLSVLNSENSNADDLLIEEESTPDEKRTKKSSNVGSSLIMLLLFAVIGGAYYYIKIYRNKRDEQMDLIDALDRDDFAVKDEDTDDGVDFGLDEDYQEQEMTRLMNDDFIPEEPDVTADEKFYATSHKEDQAKIAEEPEFQQEMPYDEDLDAPDDDEEDE